MESFHTNQPVEILIVDDEPQAVKYFKKAFGAKYEVLTATSADEAEISRSLRRPQHRARHY